MHQSVPAKTAARLPNPLSALPLVALALAAAATRPAAAAALVSDETIKIERSQTSTHKLANGMPVIIRQMPGSDLLQVSVSFNQGLKDLPPGKKVLNDWLWGTLPMAAKDYPKEKVFALSEQYGLNLGCGGGIEIASCSLGTLNEYWDKGLPLLGALIKDPSFTDEDAKLVRERLVSKYKAATVDPGNYVNEVVNSIFYPRGHPYRLNSDEALAELAKLKRQDLVEAHKKVLNAGIMSIVVVTSMPTDAVLKDLEGTFGAIKAGKAAPVTPKDPEFKSANAYKFEARDIPTAFIRVKFNAPGARHKDAVAARLLFEILSEELGEEIRTKRSLSYAVHAFVIQHSIGIGVISASTSKPKETLEAIQLVIDKVKSKVYGAEEIEEYKNAFATGFYLTQETHESMAEALAAARYMYGDPAEHYEFPRKLAAVTGADVNRLAGALLSDMRIAVIFGRKDFEDQWAKDFVAKLSRAGAKPPKKGH